MGEKKNQVGAAHKALYRKHRSKSLDEIVGQEHITKTLANAIKQGKISHAYLFTGPRGVGKTSIARILAHEINGLPYGDEKTHLDIIEIDAASNRRIDDIRDLRDKVHIAPTSAKYKVYIIDEVHMLTSESFNALLKTLEEPPAHVVFILATTEVHKLPATIVSRTQRHGFRSIAPEKVAAHLKDISKQEGITIDDEALKLLAEHGDGSFRDSISLLDQMSSSDKPITVDLVELLLGLAPRDSLQKLLDSTQAGDSKEILSQVDSLVEMGLTPAAIATQLLKLIRVDAKSNSVSTQIVQLMQDLLSVSSAQYPQLKLESILLGVNPQGIPTQSVRSADQTGKAATQTKKETSTAALKPEPSSNETHLARHPELDSGSNQKSNAEGIQKELDPPVKPEDDKPLKNEDTSISTKSTDEKSTSTQDGSRKKSGSFSVEENWPGILDATKKKNNPLYTVLRLATPELNGSELTLIFGFPFHQKKLAEPKYKALVAEIIQEQTGADVSIEAVIDKSRLKPMGDIVAESAEVKPTPDPAHASLISNVQDIMGGGEVVSV